MLLQRRGALINVTGDATALSAAAPHISGFLSALPAEAGAPSDWRSMLARQNEALVVPTQVCFPLYHSCENIRLQHYGSAGHLPTSMFRCTVSDIALSSS